MSLSVNDPRSRGKSPGRERSRSRSHRAPSPPQVKPKKSSKESSSRPSKKFYSDDSDSDSRTRKPRSSKKYYDDDDDSDLDPRSQQKPTRKYYDDDYSDVGGKSKKSSSKRYDDNSSDSDSSPRRTRSTKKYYADEKHRSDNESDSDRDRRNTQSRSTKSKYEVAEPKRRPASPPGTRSTALARKDAYEESKYRRVSPPSTHSTALARKDSFDEAADAAKYRRASPPYTHSTILTRKDSFDEPADAKYRRALPSDTHSSALAREESFDEAADAARYRRASPPGIRSTTLACKDEYIQPSKPHYEEHRDERHASYTSPERHEPVRPSDQLRKGYSNGGPERRSPEAKVPGTYKWEYDHDRSSPPASGPEQSRHLAMSTSGGFNVSIGGGHTQSQYAQAPPPLHTTQSQYGQASSPSHPTQLQYGLPTSPPHTNQPLSPQLTQSQHRAELNQNQSSGANTSMYADLTHQVKYAELPQQITYGSKIDVRKPTYTQSAQPQFLEMKPQYGTLQPNPAEAAGSRMHRLSVSGGVSGGLSLVAPGQQGHMQGGLPPGSPLLEAYRGTYQSISPMPSPLMLPSTMDDDLSDLESLSRYSSDDSRRGTSHKSVLKKRVVFYNPEEDAIALANALKYSKIDSGPIVKILPRLSDDAVMELRTEYKKHYKVSGKGINIAKHLKLKVPGNLGKIAYAVALGRWESEAHWANFWYQSNTSRRELLIESLIGRSNSEIVKIKDAFNDKRYNDSLEKCMQTELKKDKFRTAILLALEERRMEEIDKVSPDLVRRDAQELYRALTAKEGGETAMINIIVVRSDNHLREVLRTFEASYRKNFAREMIQKSRNLVVSGPNHVSFFVN